VSLPPPPNRIPTETWIALGRIWLNWAGDATSQDILDVLEPTVNECHCPMCIKGYDQACMVTRDSDR
jgi:hypothetical protein